MKIDRVSVTYGELRSKGYPDFTNKSVEITLSATLQAGDTPERVKERLYAHAEEAVKEKFGDNDTEQLTINLMEIPF